MVIIFAVFFSKCVEVWRAFLKEILWEENHQASFYLSLKTYSCYFCQRIKEINLVKFLKRNIFSQCTFQALNGFIDTTINGISVAILWYWICLILSSTIMDHPRFLFERIFIYSFKQLSNNYSFKKSLLLWNNVTLLFQ